MTLAWYSEPEAGEVTEFLLPAELRVFLGAIGGGILIFNGLVAMSGSAAKFQEDCTRLETRRFGSPEEWGSGIIRTIVPTMRGRAKLYTIGNKP